MNSPASPAQKQTYAHFVVALMAGFAPVQAKRMFGGFGIFWQGLMLAIIVNEQLYFKVDELLEPRFQARGLPRFGYEAKGRHRVSLRYCQAPPEVFDEPDQMAEWARLAFECAVRQQGQAGKSGKGAKGGKAVTGHAAQQGQRAAQGPRPGSGAQATPPAGQALGALRNLGPKSAEMLAMAGIHDEAALRELGAVLAYARTKRACPRASLNLLWALEGALTGRDWQEVAASDRASLLMALEDVQRHLGV